MRQRIRFLRLVATALAIAAQSSTAFVHTRGRRQPAFDRGSGEHQRQQRSGDKPCRSGALASQKLVASKHLPRLRPPWLASGAGLRGGAGGTGSGGSSVVVSPGGARVAAPSKSVRRSLAICGLFSLSYLCSVLFNVNNKRALLLVPLPWTYAALNLSIGSVVALLSWSAKVAPWPKIEWQDAAALVPMGLLHAVSHLTVVLGLGAGAVSFLQTVKASEACFTALLSYLFLGQTLPLPVYLTLLPVVLGVALTCCGQGLRFSWLALLSALVSNLSNALRNVLIVKNIGPAAAARRSDLESAASTNAKSNERAGISPLRATSSFLRPTASGATVSSAAADAFVNNPIARRIRSVAALANTRAGGEVSAVTATARHRRTGLVDLAPGDTFRLCSVVGAALLIPAAAYFERDSWPRLWRGAADAARALVGRNIGGGGGGSAPLEEALRKGVGAAAAVDLGGAAAAVAEAEATAAAAVRGDWAEAFRRALLSGVCFNLFYDLTFRLLGQLHPVTHAVGNTIKRIVVIAAGAFVFGGDLGGARGAVGSGLAVLGVLAYSVAKAFCQPAQDHSGRSSR